MRKEYGKSIENEHFLVCIACICQNPGRGRGQQQKAIRCQDGFWEEWKRRVCYENEKSVGKDPRGGIDF